MLRKIANFWLRHIYPSLAPLIATFGLFGLASCLFILFVLAELFEECIGLQMSLQVTKLGFSG